jgi:TetR/AcrR family transcriptional regulator
MGQAKRTDRLPTRERILRAAARLFARHGYDGTATSAIVGAAGVNKRMLYHWFGDKRGLYREVFRAQWEALRRGLAGRATLEEALGGLFDHFARHREFVRLLLWEGLEGGEIARSIWKEARGPLFEEAVALVRAAQKAGRLDRRLDATHLIITFLGAVVYYFAYAPSLSDMLGKDALAPATIRERRREVMRLLAAIARR